MENTLTTHTHTYQHAAGLLFLHDPCLLFLGLYYLLGLYFLLGRSF
jgi:hypothetical protein